MRKSSIKQSVSGSGREERTIEYYNPVIYAVHYFYFFTNFSSQPIMTRKITKLELSGEISFKDYGK